MNIPALAVPEMPMHLTALFKLQANDHDRRRLDVALGRWSRAMNEALDRARALRPAGHHRGQRELLRCIRLWTSKDGMRSALVVDRKRLHALVLALCAGLTTDLHSSSKMSLIVAVEELLASYLGQIIDWKKADPKLKLPNPSFPRLPPATDALAEVRWIFALEQARACASYEEEVPWRSALLRASRARLLPLYFGAATSGADGSQAHMGLLQREDGRLFALLTLFGTGDALGEPVRRARNRRDRGGIRTVLGHGRRQRLRKPRDGAQAVMDGATGSLPEDGADGSGPEDGAALAHAPSEPGVGAGVRQARPFAPTDRARASILVPLAFSRGDDPTSAHGREFLFLRRAAPKSAELVHQEGEWYLHVAFEFPDHPARARSGAVLALKRGIGTLIAYVVLDGAGSEQARGRLEGGDLVRLVTMIRAKRAILQARGYTLKGDRRLARLTEGHLYSAGHQIVDLACQHGAEIVLLKDRLARKPQPFLAYRHFHRLAEILEQLAAEAGLAAPRERELYGHWSTCLQCGWRPGEPVRLENPGAEQCPACGTPREPEFHLAALLAWDTLRLRATGPEKPPPLGHFIRQLRQSGPA